MGASRALVAEPLGEDAPEEAGSVTNHARFGLSAQARPLVAADFDYPVAFAECIGNELPGSRNQQTPSPRERTFWRS